MARNRSGEQEAAARLMTAARRARRRARTPFSGFKVGAAVETADGTIVTGCNIENASYGLTMCAERVAMFTALAAGHRRFRRLAIVADASTPTTPCGACRQILWEFAGDIEILLANLRRLMDRRGLGELLPMPFDADVLGMPTERGVERRAAAHIRTNKRSCPRTDKR